MHTVLHWLQNNYVFVAGSIITLITSSFVALSVARLAMKPRIIKAMLTDDKVTIQFNQYPSPLNSPVTLSFLAHIEYATGIKSQLFLNAKLIPSKASGLKEVTLNEVTVDVDGGGVFKNRMELLTYGAEGVTKDTTFDGWTATVWVTLAAGNSKTLFKKHALIGLPQDGIR